MFGIFYRYNGGMENDKYSPYSQCCGRPMNYAPKPKCNYNDCCLNEYHHTMPACIRNKQPDCTAKAVIPSITVDTVDGITNLANCFVHVTSNNTTYYIDDKHRPIITWAGDVEVELPADVITNEQFEAFIRSFNLREQQLRVKLFSNDISKYVIEVFYFDKTGKIYSAGEYEEITEGV